MSTKKKVKRKLRWGRLLAVILIAALLITGTVVFAKFHSAKKELKEGGSNAFIAVLGIDARESLDSVRSDVMMIAYVDFANKKLNLISIPRDSMVPIPCEGGEFDKITHAVKMESLQDVFSTDEVIAFTERVKADFPDASFTVEPKIDGLSVSLEYENGVFVRGSTRGDGVVGEDVTANLLKIKEIPHKINTKIAYLEVRGEVYMSHQSFFDCVTKQENNGEVPFKNPRNAAAGSLRQKNSAVVADRNLSIFIFNIQSV